jgi:hypothetical protein
LFTGLTIYEPNNIIWGTRGPLSKLIHFRAGSLLYGQRVGPKVHKCNSQTIYCNMYGVKPIVESQIIESNQ